MKKLLSMTLLVATAFFALPAIAGPVKKDGQNKKKNDCHCAEIKTCKEDCPKTCTQFGYFYLNDPQTVQGGCFEAINWRDASSINSEEIFLDPSCHTKIILKKPGIYRVHFILTGEASNQLDSSILESILATNGSGSACPEFQFALHLNNGSAIPGSTYATNNINFSLPKAATNENSCEYCDGCDTQLNGQAVFRVFERNSTLTLVNQGENCVLLDNHAGTNCPERFGDNVSASIYIERIAG